MAETENSFDWGIDTFASGSGNQELLDDILGGDVITTDPKEVQLNNETNEEKEKVEDQNIPLKKQSKKVSIEDVLGDEEVEDEEDEEQEEEEEKPSDTTETEPTEDEDTSEEGDEDDDKQTPQNSYSALSQDLIKLGVFEEDEDLDVPESGEELLERFNIESQKRAQYALNNYLSRFGEDRRELFDAIFNKNVDPKEYIKSFVRLENFSNLDIEKESNQEKVVRQFLSSQGGFDQEDIEEEVNRLKEYGDLERMSKKYHKVLVANEQKELQKKAELAEQKLELEKQRDDQYKTAVSTLLSDKLKSRNLDGIPLTPAVANQLEEDLTVKKYKLPSGELLTEFDKFLLEVRNNPQFFPLKVKIALLEKHGFDLTKLASKLQSQESNEIFDSLARQTKKTSIKKNKSKSTEKEDDLFSLWARPK